MHGCAYELRRLIERAKPDRVVLVGDLFTKGPDPRGVFEQVRRHRAVLGNHDERLFAPRPSDRHAMAVARAIGDEGMTWLHTLPLTIELDGFTVVHAGMHPTEPTSRKQMLTMRKAGEQYWWKQYAGERGVIFGHDARRGLIRVEREGKPYLLGLDTGCVYGGRLTGWILEEDRYVQVKARRPYVKVGAA